MELYTQTGEVRTLEGEALGSGGEGTVYAIANVPGSVAKVYHDASAARAREDKLRAMVELARTSARGADFYAHIAWPRALLYDAFGCFMGFEMERKSAAFELDDLYAFPPKSGADIPLTAKLDAVIGLCDAVQLLHDCGQVIGDFNPHNIQVDGKNNWSVCLLDADSFHINCNGMVYRCVACAPGYVAPEVIKNCKGSNYQTSRGETFTVESDRFGLAIHIFAALMNGAHPYACQLVEDGRSELTAKGLDQRVELGETPFFRSLPDQQPPSFAPDIHALPPYLLQLFRRAFVSGASDRPAANEWRAALLRFKAELIPCAEGHLFWNGAPSCPYCAAKQRFQTGIVAARSVATSSHTASAGQQTVHNAGTAAYAGSSAAGAFFWALTIVISTLATGALAWRYPDFFLLNGYPTLSKIFFFLCCASAVAGSSVYNGKCFSDQRGALWNSVLSVLMGVCLGVLAAIALKLLTIGVIFVGGLILTVVGIALAFALAAAVVILPIALLIHFIR